MNNNFPEEGGDYIKAKLREVPTEQDLNSRTPGWETPCYAAVPGT